MQAGEAPHNAGSRRAPNSGHFIGMRIELHEGHRGDRNETPDPLELSGITIEFSIDESDDEALSSPSRNGHGPLRFTMKPSSIQQNVDSQKASAALTPLMRERLPSKTKLARETTSRNSGSGRLPKNQTLTSRNDIVTGPNNCGIQPEMKRGLTSTAPSITPNSSNSPIATGHQHTSTDDLTSKPTLHAFEETGSNVKHSKTLASGITHSSDARAVSDADRARRRMDRKLLQEKKRLHEERRNATLKQLRRPSQCSAYIEQSSSSRSLDVDDLYIPRPLVRRYSFSDAHSGSCTKSILKQGRFSLPGSSSTFKQKRLHDSQASHPSLRVRFQDDERLSHSANSVLLFSESCTSLKYDASGHPPDQHPEQQGYNRAINASDDNSGIPHKHGRCSIKADSHVGSQEGNQSREFLPATSTLGGSSFEYSSESRRFGLPPPLMSTGRQLTPQEHHQLNGRQEELQRQMHARQQHEKTSRRGLFGRKSKHEPIDPPPMTDHQRRMAAAQAAFAMIGGDRL